MMRRPAWHFSLTDGTTTLRFLCCDPSGREFGLRYWGRQPLDKSAMKLGQGRTRYDDLIPPWYAVAQDDWGGGRGGVNLLDDPTRYADSDAVQAWIPGRLVLGPERHVDFYGAEDIDTAAGGAAGSKTLTGGAGFARAQTFTVEHTMVVSSVEVYLAFSVSGSGTVTVTVKLTETDTGKPDETETLATDVREFVDPADGEGYEAFDIETTLAPGVYAVVVEATTTAGSAALSYDLLNDYSGGAAYYRNSGIWQTDDINDYNLHVYTDEDAPAGARARFYTTRGLLHVLFSGEATNKLYRRGILGTATDGGEDTLTDSGAAFTADMVGAVVAIISGTGAGQRREIKSRTSTILTVSSVWDVEPDATSVYAVASGWAYVGAISGTVRDVLVVDSVTYYARGVEADIRRHVWTDAGGDQFDDDTGNKADRLVLFRDENNDPAIWRALGHEISAASPAEWGTDLEFGTETRIGSEDSRITALTVYDDHLYIGKEDGLWAVQEDIARLIPVHFAALRSPDNCQNMTAWNLYLIFPLLDGLQRLYGSQVDDFGPNGGRGLPDGRQGPISAIMPLPGLLVVAVDAGVEGYSAVLVYNNLGWHELARAENAGDRITSLAYEVLEDSARLWWNEGARLAYAWMSRRTFDRSRDAEADWADEGTLTTAWLGADLEGVDKLWRAVSVIKDEDTTFEGSAAVAVDYRVNDESAGWTAAAQTAASATRDEFDLGPVVGRRLQLRLTLEKGGDIVYGWTTPEIRAVTVDAMGRVETGHAMQTRVALDRAAISQTGKPEEQDPAVVLAKLDAWAGGTTVLTLAHELPEFNGLEVILEPVTFAIGEATGGELVTRRVLDLVMIELD